MPRYYYPNARNTTEKTPSISIFWLKKNHYLHGVWNEGSISWRRRGVMFGPVYFTIDIKDNLKESVIHIGHFNNTKYTYRLLPFPCFLGGHRWFFECGATRNGDYCGNRVGILYLKDNKFICRECANLSYQSCNENKLYRNNPFQIITRSNKASKIKSTMRKEIYKGKPTRKSRRVNKIMGSITEDDIREAEVSLFKN
jgi:hypothetical protein